MKQKLIIVLFAVVLLLVIGAAGMYASSLLKSRAAKEADGDTTTQEVASVPAPPDVPETAPDGSRTTPNKTTPVKPPADTSSRATPPRSGAIPAPNAVGEEPPSRPPFAERGRGGPRDMPGFEKLRGKMELSGLFNSIGQLDELKTPLTEKQAKAILAVMNPLRKQATLSPEEADKALAKLKAELTKEQLDAIAKAREQMMRGGMGGRPGGGQRGGAPPNAAENGGRPPRNADGAPGADDTPRRRGGGERGTGSVGGGAGGRGGGNPGDILARMETMNPFNPGDDERSQRRAERINTVFTALEAKAAGK